MRSRNGNNTSSFRIAKIIFILYSFALNANEYLISYRYTVKDSMLYNEKLFISKAMSKCKQTTYLKPLILPNKENSLKKTIDKNKELFSNYLSKIGFNINYKSKTTNLNNHSFMVYTFKTTCFKVDFNDNFVKIQPLK